MATEIRMGTVTPYLVPDKVAPKAAFVIQQQRIILKHSKWSFSNALMLRFQARCPTSNACFPMTLRVRRTLSGSAGLMDYTARTVVRSP